MIVEYAMRDDDEVATKKREEKCACAKEEEEKKKKKTLYMVFVVDYIHARMYSCQVFLTVFLDARYICGL